MPCLGFEPKHFQIGSTLPQSIKVLHRTRLKDAAHISTYKRRRIEMKEKKAAITKQQRQVQEGFGFSNCSVRDRKANS
jgi:hypothetical protein